MSVRARKAIMLALMAPLGFASGIYIAHNDPDMITLVWMGAAVGTVSFSLSWWVVRPMRVLHDGQED